MGSPCNSSSSPELIQAPEITPPVPGPPDSSNAGSPGTIVVQEERRSKKRFPLSFQVKYMGVGRRGQIRVQGIGLLVDISSRAIALRTPSPVPAGMKAEVFIRWPVLLNNECRLQLFVLGRVLRSEAEFMVVSIERYEFRTTGRVASLSTAAGATG